MFPSVRNGNTYRGDIRSNCRQEGWIHLLLIVNVHRVVLAPFKLQTGQAGKKLQTQRMNRVIESVCTCGLLDLSLLLFVVTWTLMCTSLHSVSTGLRVSTSNKRGHHILVTAANQSIQAKASNNEALSRQGFRHAESLWQEVHVEGDVHVQPHGETYTQMRKEGRSYQRKTVIYGPWNNVRAYVYTAVWYFHTYCTLFTHTVHILYAL